MAVHLITIPTIEEIEFEIILHEEHIPVKGNAIASGDEAYDRKVENKIYRELDNGNLWAWCTVQVKGTYKGLSASDYLGACSYRNEKGFKKGGYYDDMKRTVFTELITKLMAL